MGGLDKRFFVLPTSSQQRPLPLPLSSPYSSRWARSLFFFQRPGGRGRGFGGLNEIRYCLRSFIDIYYVYHFHHTIFPNSREWRISPPFEPP